MRFRALGRWLAPAACLWVGPLASAAYGSQEATLVVLGGDGTKASDAQKTLARWNEEKAAIASVLAPAPGFPRIVTSAEVPELPPGEYAVALGFCPPDREWGVAMSLAAMRPGTWHDEVRRPDGPLPCPEPVGGWSFQDFMILNTPEGTLSASSFVQAGAVSGTQASLVLVYLRAPDDRLSDWKEISIPAGCSVAIKEEPGVLRIERTCPPSGEQARPLRFAIRGGKLAQAAGLGEMKDVRAVVWGGGRTPEDAQAALARWEKDRAAIAEAIALPAGYPRAVSAADYPGLGSTGSVVLLGLCPSSRLKDVLETLGAFDPSIRATKVTVQSGDPACPEIANEWKVKRTEKVRVGTATLTVVKLVQPAWNWMDRVFLRDAKGVLLDWKGTDTRSIAVNNGGSCLVAELVRKKAGITLELQCSAPVADDRDEDRWTQRVTYSVRSGKIAEKAESPDEGKSK